MSFKRILFCSDLHGDKSDPGAVKALLKFCKLWKPQIRVFGGDLWDFRAMRKGASEEERRDSMLRDYADGLQFLTEFRPQYFLRGNHDERLWDLAQCDNGLLSDLAIRKTQEVEEECKAISCRMLPYHKRDGVLKLGSLKMLHGYAVGINAARKHAWTYGSCLFGHVHSIDHVTLERTEKTMARACGCLTKLDHEYNRAQIGSLRHAHGWAYGVVNEKTGSFHVWQAERIGGKFMCATELIEL
jgi:hypothetical protein